MVVFNLPPCCDCSDAGAADLPENQRSQEIPSPSQICEQPAPRRDKSPNCCPAQEETNPSSETMLQDIKEFICELEQMQLENLVKDRYCPGVIQETVNGCEDFNALAFDVVFGKCDLPECQPIVDPISLIEAMDMRIDLERCEVNQQVITNNSINGSVLANNSRIEESFRCKYKTELNYALQSFLKAEELFLAEIPTANLPSFEADIQKAEIMMPGKPIKVRAFTGSTTPKEC